MKGRQNLRCGVCPKANTGTMGAPASIATLQARGAHTMCSAGGRAPLRHAPAGAYPPPAGLPRVPQPLQQRRPSLPARPPVPGCLPQHACSSPHKAGTLAQEHHLPLCVWFHVEAPVVRAVLLQQN